MPRPETGHGWTYLEHVYSAASTGAEAADADLDGVLKVASILSAQQAVLDRRTKSFDRATTGLPLDADVLQQVYSRQILDSQKMSAAVCSVMAGVGPGEAMTALEGMVQRFDAAMTGVLAGLPQAGVATPPTAAIGVELQGARSAWTDVRDIAGAAAAGQAVAEEDLLRFAQAMDHVQRHMHAARLLLRERSLRTS